MNDVLYLGLGYIGAGIGAGLCVIGGAYGIGRLATAALEGTARQPEASKDLRTSMIIPAAMIEGAMLLGLVICLLVMLNLGLKPTPQSQPAQAAAAEQPKH